MVLVQILTKPACCLCDSIVFIAQRLKPRYPQVRFQKLNIEHMKEYQHYLNEVPVVLIDGAEFSKVTFREQDFKQKLDELVAP